MIETSDGGYIIGGVINNGSDDDPIFLGENDIWIMKIDSSGNLIWQKSVGGPDTDFLYDIAEMPNHDIVGVGATNSSSGDFNATGPSAAVVRWDASGNLIWAKSFPTNAYNAGYDVLATDDGDIMMVCAGSASDGLLAGTSDSPYVRSCITKLDGAGNLISSHAFESDSGNLYFRSISQLPNGDFLVGGDVTSTNSMFGTTQNRDGLVLEFAPDGELVWFKTLGGSSTDYIYSAFEDTDGYYVASGYTFSNDGDCAGNNGATDGWLIKFTNLLGVTESTTASLALYPNPAVDVIHFSETLDDSAHIGIFDLTGKEVINQLGGDAVDLGKLAAGVYIVKVEENEAVRTQRFVKI